MLRKYAQKHIMLCRRSGLRVGVSVHPDGYTITPLRDNGHPCFSASTAQEIEVWQRIGEIGESLGVVWAGLEDPSHFSLPAPEKKKPRKK